MDAPITVRVKRHRDSTAPQQIILEAATKPGTPAALASELHRSLGLQRPEGSTGAAEAPPPKRRCRFVLVGSSTSNHPGAAASSTVGSGQGPVLELWHTAAFAAAGQAASTAAAPAPAGPEQPSASRAADGSELPHGDVYSSMLQQYMQEHEHQGSQKQQEVSRVPHPVYKRPSRRIHHAPSAPVSAQGAGGAVQLQNPHPQLPAYMTRAMLQQYGLLQHASSQQQQQQATQASAVPSAAASASADAVMRDSSSVGDAENNYEYDVYMAVGPDDSSSSAWEWYSPLDGQEQQQEDAGGLRSSQCAAEGANFQQLPVIQVWEDDLLDELQQSGPGGPGAPGAVDPDSEDSNAEDYYANSYPDEDDNNSYQDDMDSSDMEEGQRDGPQGRAVFDDAGDGLGSYKLQGDSGGQRVQRQHGSGVRDHLIEGDESSEYDVDDYVSSGDEGGVGERGDGGAWLRRHCPGYAAGTAGSGPAAWRAVLAQQHHAPADG